MIKTKIVETTEKYDKDGKLIEKMIREETSEDNTNYGGTSSLNADDIIKCLKEKEMRTGIRFLL